METLILTDLFTSEPKELTFTSPTLLLFFSLKDTTLIKEIQTNISLTSLNPAAVYIGEEVNNPNFWKQKEIDSFEIFNGGSSLKPFSVYQISEIPSIVIIKNNSLFFSKKVAELEKPFVKSIIRLYPEFKKQGTIEDIIQSKALSLDEKIDLLEKLSSESQAEVEILSKELGEKDRIIRDIFHRLNVILGNRGMRKRKTKSSVIEEVKIQYVEPVQGDRDDMPKDLWIYSITKAKPLFPAINPRSKPSSNQRSKSITLASKII